MPIHLEIPHLKEIRVKLLPGLGQKAGVFFNFLSEEWVSPQKIPFLSKWWWGGVPQFEKSMFTLVDSIQDGRQRDFTVCLFF